MAWAKLDDRFFSHPKVIDLSKDAKLLFLCALTYCSAHLTDGKISRGAFRMIAAQVDVDEQTAQQLIEARLWNADEDGFQIVPSKLYSMSYDGRDEWDAMRDAVAPLVYARDNFTCVYCGSTENLTIDHIVAVSRGGSNLIKNLATACRSCNSSKGAKTPEEWIQA